MSSINISTGVFKNTHVMDKAVNNKEMWQVCDNLNYNCEPQKRQLNLDLPP